nr:MAG TPA: YtxH-like protein [Caudoviricetes sp.]
MQETDDKKEGDNMEELKAFVADKRFLVGLVLGFALGALHHYFGL